MKLKSIFIVAVAVAGLAQSRLSAAQADELTLYYHPRPPYAAKQPDGSVSGITADIAATAFAKAGIPYRWEELPSARQLEALKTNAAACGLGWFKRPDREAFATFSAALYKDHPTVAVARADDDRFPASPSIARLFADKRLVLLLKTGYSYGSQIDSRIKADAPPSRVSSGDNVTMLRLVEMKRVDYMLMAKEEATYLLSLPDFANRGLRSLQLSDAPEGEIRYLMCSKTVPAESIDKINRAIPPL